MFSDTATRVEKRTTAYVNQKIADAFHARTERYQYETKDAITRRLEELDHEWDVERALQTNFATLSLVGVALTASVNKQWAALPLAVPAFMVQHALQGWCPPLGVLRRMKFRTAKEIHEERFALKALRGDFAKAAHTGRIEDLLEAVRK